MLTVLGPAGHACDGVSRRAILRAGGLSMFGGLLAKTPAGQAATSAKPAARVKSIVLIDLFGGPKSPCVKTVDDFVLVFGRCVRQESSMDVVDFGG